MNHALQAQKGSYYIWIVKDTNNEIESILEIEKNISF